MRTDCVHPKGLFALIPENCESWAASYISHNMCTKKEMWLLRSVYVTQSNLSLLEICSACSYLATFFSPFTPDIWWHLKIAWQITGSIMDWSETKPAKFVVHIRAYKFRISVDSWNEWRETFLYFHLIVKKKMVCFWLKSIIEMIKASCAIADYMKTCQILDSGLPCLNIPAGK